MRASKMRDNSIYQGMKCFLDGKSLIIARPNTLNTQGRDFQGWGWSEWLRGERGVH